MRDTLELWHLPNQRYISLRFLASYLLKKDIQVRKQNTQASTNDDLPLISISFLALTHTNTHTHTHTQDEVHDSIEDAKTALLLYRHYEQALAMGQAHLADLLEQMYAHGKACEWRVRDVDLS